MRKLSSQEIKKSIERCKKYRKRILEISQNVTALHIGGSFSCTEMLDVLFNIVMNNQERGNFILSKGHASIIQYVILEDKKILKKKMLDSYCKKHGILGVHPDIGNPGINASTGSLGHGLALSAGMALAEKKNIIYTLLSDGELQEGSTWEAVIAIGALKLNNIVVLIDNNNLQSFEFTSNSHKNLYPIYQKYKSFGWDAVTCNGHSVEAIYRAISKKKNKPLAIIAKTEKGYPISFMKNKAIWHYKSPTPEEYQKAINELNEK